VRQPVVIAAERREPGFVRIRLAPLGAEGELRVSLPIAFGVSGELRGLGVAAYPETAPERATVLAPRRFAR
jgi:hypothetical protein